MGVSGSGKTTIGKLLAAKLSLPFFDADDFHPDFNVKKMASGIPLDDLDRQPWLEKLAQHIIDWEQHKGAVLACSALKEKYRQILGSNKKINWIYLDGNKDLIGNRMQARLGHYMKAGLLDSQFEALEIPSYGIHAPIERDPQSIIQHILQALNIHQNLSEIGILGMGVMGKSLALNCAEKGIKTAIYNRHVPGKEEKIAQNVVKDNPQMRHLIPFDELQVFLHNLEVPRKILLMIPAGEAVDQQIQQLIPFLEDGDVIIDGGNSHYEDSSRRAAFLEKNGLRFVAMGVSGGEEGARKGPSMMPGGDREAVKGLLPIFEKIAAKNTNGEPCVAYIGPEGSGHFVKMVHNSIEYGEMQLLAEVYGLMRYYFAMHPPQIAEILEQWLNQGESSYLLEITIDIMRTKEGQEYLLDKILDQAAQKGTGGWSVEAALKHAVPYGPLVEAVMARIISSQKSNRLALSNLYGIQKPKGDFDYSELLEDLKNAYRTVRILNHEIGFSLIKQASDDHKWSLDLAKIAGIWTNGCIIRSDLMMKLSTLLDENSYILEMDDYVSLLRSDHKSLGKVISASINAGVAIPVMSAAFQYFLGRVTASSSANLIQAQRDYFGAHTYQRVDKGPDEYFHTEWKKSGD